MVLHLFAGSKLTLKLESLAATGFLPHFRTLGAVAAVVCAAPSSAISTGAGGQGHFTPGWSPAAKAAGPLRLLAISENQISPVLWTGAAVN